MTDGVTMRLDLFEKARGFQLGNDGSARLETIEALETLRRGQADSRIGRQDVDARQAVAATDLEVGGVVRGRDLDRAGAEGRIHGIVGDDRNQAIGERQTKLLADQSSIALVSGMHRDGGIAEHRLRPRCRHGDMAASLCERISQVPDAAIDLLLFGLLVRQCREAAGAPIDDVLSAINQAFVVQRDERLSNSTAQSLVEREVGASPVRRAADGAQLGENGGAGLPHVSPDPLHEGLAADIESSLTLRGQNPFDHVLRGDAGVIGARKPESGPSPHPLEPNQDILNGVIEAVTHVERRRHVGWRHHDHVWFPGARRGISGLGQEESALFPPGIQRGLDGGRIVLRRERLGHAL